MKTLITGGCRSGKSQYALKIASKLSGSKVFIATAEARDNEMRNRIKKHQKERGPEWLTVEEPLNLSNVLREEEKRQTKIIVLDCITLWISNLLLMPLSSEKIFRRVDEVLNYCIQSKMKLIFITNEVGAGIVPESELGRQFRDLAGIVNQKFASHFDEVVNMVSGIPMVIKNSVKNRDSQSKDSFLDEEKKSNIHEFSDIHKQGLYQAIFKRRDIRSFKSQPIPPKVLGKVLHAAHNAGSVGFMQPWNFIIIDNNQIKQKVVENFKEANSQARTRFKGERQKLYDNLKLEGILEAPINICVTCDRSRFGPHVLGKNTVFETDIYSTCCAIQNLWLAARVEGLAVGWVSILNLDQIKKDLKLPEDVIPIAYLCVGYTDKFEDKPILETKGWADRLELKNLVCYNYWNGSPKNKVVEI